MKSLTAATISGLLLSGWYVVHFDGVPQAPVQAVNGAVQVGVPAGSHRIALQPVQADPTKTATPSATQTPRPTPTATRMLFDPAGRNKKWFRQ